VKDQDPKFDETCAQLAQKLSAVVEKYASVAEDDTTKLDAIRTDGKAAFDAVFSALQGPPKSAWRRAQLDFHEQLAVKRFALATTANWREIYTATAQGLALAGAERQVVADQVGDGFWKKNGDENGATYWDERFDDSAEKLAARMEKVADNDALATSNAIQQELVKEFNEFLTSIHNERVPEKKAAWRDLILAWREKLVAAHQEGSFNPADLEALRTAIREGAKDLRQAGKDWTAERQRASKGSSAAAGGAAGASSVGAGGTYYGTSHAALHHARAMNRIHYRHTRRAARIGYIYGR
jgi:hypothetical protein